MGFLDIFKPVFGGVESESRRWHAVEGRVMLEYRAAPAGRLASFARQVEEALTSLDGVLWAELDPRVRRVVIAHEPGAYTAAQLEAVLASVEQRAGLEAAPFERGEIEHPADEQPVLQGAVELGAAALGLAVGAALRASPLPAIPLGANVAGLISVANAVPRLRRALDRRWGARAVDHAFNVASPIAHGTSQRVFAPLVDLAYRAALLDERRARRQVFLRREGALCAGPSRRGGAVEPAPSRSRPLPAGPIEQHAEGAWQVALGAFAISLFSTRSVRKAAPALFVGLPKPARLGREVFAARLGRALARREMLVVDPGALRRLDRVDCLVLQGDLVPRERFRVGQVSVGAGITQRDALARVRSMFDPDDPIARVRDGAWSLGPTPLLDAAMPASLASRARELARSGALVLGLTQGGDVVALCEVQITPQTGVEELIRSARKADMRVLVAADDAAALHGFAADDVIAEGDEMAAAIRDLQREGHVVCVVATGASPGLDVADVGVGLVREGEPAPWGADVVCGEDLGDARFVLQACIAAREASRQSVRVALSTAAIGSFLSAGGLLPMDSRRAMLVVNAATLVSMANGLRVAYELDRSRLPDPRDPTPWHALDPDGALARLRSSRQGLAAREAARRDRPEVPPLPAIFELGQAIVDEVLNPLVPLLAAGAGMSAFVGSLVDAGMVAGVVGLNAVVGGAQRFQAERAIRDLSRTEERRAVVLRGGRREVIEASKLVKGDVVLLVAGDVVPADCRVIEAISLEIDAASLTGESLPVAKQRAPSFAREVAEQASMLHEGTAIAAGQATAVVVATGSDTEAMRGAASGPVAASRTGVEARLTELMKLTGPVAGVAGVALAVTGLARSRGLDDIVGSAVSLAVASVPEGLPLLATAAQLAAARRLSLRGALVRHPRAIEALGRVDVVCIDKTGTVTQGRVALVRVSDGSRDEATGELGDALREVLAVALRATPDGVLDTPNPEAVDEALVRGAAAFAPIEPSTSAARRRVAEVSFEARRGYHAVAWAMGDDAASPCTLAVKGAPEALLPRCARRRAQGEERALGSDDRRALAAEVARFAASGLRVLAVAERPFDAGPSCALADGDVRDLVFLGFVAFQDPVRPTAASAVAQLRRAGVDVVMVTGDHPSTAEAVGSELGMLLPGGTMTGAELDRLSDEALARRAPSISIFARVTPAQKVRVVRALQRAGRVVGMAGDGANDAPAIRLADVGLAIGERSTAAARGAADVVLLDERIETLVDAVLEGRALWGAVRDAVSVLVGGNIGEILFTVGVGVVDGRSPLNARQLLLVNLLTDVAPAMAIALRPPRDADRDALAHEGPDAALGRGLQRDIAVRSGATALGAGAAWLVGRLTGPEDRARTMGMVALVGSQLGQTLLSGSLTPAVGVATLGSAALLAAIVQTPGISQFFGCTPLGPTGWATALSASTLASFASQHFTGELRSLPWRFLTRPAPPAPTDTVTP